MSLRLGSAYSAARSACTCCSDLEEDDVSDEACGGAAARQLRRNDGGGLQLVPTACSGTSCSSNSSAAPVGSSAARELGVALPDIQFSAAHFVAFRGFRERLHGHNYSVSIRLGSEQLGADGYVIDFGDVKKAARELCRKLKERTLLPALSDVLSMKHVQNDNGNEQIQVSCEDGAQYTFPAGDCALLPIMHSTAEELSEYLWTQLVSQLGVLLKDRGVMWLEVGVQERPGQGASFRRALPQTAMTAPPTFAVLPNSSASEPDTVVPWKPAAVKPWLQDSLTASMRKDAAEAAFANLLSTLGPAEASRIGPKTPVRAAKAFLEQTQGLSGPDPLRLVRDGVFAFEGEGQLVTVRDIHFHSLCEHHLLPFSGTAHISYIPSGKILGLSKFARLVDAYARRPQVQERLTHQIVEGLATLLCPQAVMVALEARHSCMTIRGVREPNASTSTVLFAGSLKDDPMTRNMLQSSLRHPKSSL
eukprot:TRINITY_DN5047_c0_g1_i3.p1 TRINITY_DN5047_c0_g1~~TRINITY_DN5047_c0_g1_i3.p1  ORF type:complete len:476 (-),score=77.67 TRINITY_DN5047_c0_g1_i3:195-1622(-)